MEDRKDISKNFYENNRISFHELAQKSTHYLGFAVTIDQLKKWSQEDGGWKKPEILYSDQVKTLVNIVFDKIEEDYQVMDVKEFTALVNTFVNLTSKIDPPKTEAEKPVLQTIIDVVHSDVD